MKRRMWSKVIAYVMILTLVLGLYPASGMTVQAEGVISEKVVFNPRYEGILDEEAVRAELLEQQEYGGIAAFSGPAVCDSMEEAVAYVREQLTLRNTSITFWANIAWANGSIWYSDVFELAMEHREDCSGQEGDALAWGWKGLSTRWSTAAENYYELTYTVSYYTDAQQEQELTEAVDAAMAELQLDGLMEFEKAEKIHDYICDHVNYDYTYSKYSAYDALCGGEAVCQGYAILFYRMCKEAGLSVRIITGLGNGGAHAWNIVRVGGRYYNIDCTWDGQGDKIYDTYFLKSTKDFGDHIRDEEYTTAEFADTYFMAEESWMDYGSFEKPYGLDNGDFSFTTILGESVKSEAEGNPKLLVFYNLGCSNSQSELKDFSSEVWENVDIVAVETQMHSQEEVASFAAQYPNDAMAYTYNTASQDYNAMWNYAWATGNNSLMYPYIVYVDANNQFQYATMGYCGIGTVKKNLQYYCGENKVLPTGVTLDKAELTMEAGECRQVTAAVLPADAITQIVGYESSDNSVVTVDYNGNVTALSEGTATITAYAVQMASAQKATCSVVVGGEIPEATAAPTAEPTVEPTVKPTEAPTATPKPTEEPTATPKPTEEPTATPKPTEEPTATPKPTEEPTATPKPTEEPTATLKPTEEPTVPPTVEPTAEPTEEPTATPKPTEEPTATPKPTEVPTATPKPTEAPTAPTAPTEAPTPEQQVKAFVTRMYTVVMEREPDAGGIEYWTGELLSGRIDGAGISPGFIMSEEFTSKGLSDEEYLAVLYRTFFDREGDEGGINFWCETMKAGTSRATVLSGFVNSQEFFDICADYGISRGVLREDGSPVNSGIYRFSERLYSTILGREGDKDGIEYWTCGIDNRTITPESAAQDFFWSPEYVEKNTSDEEYIKTLYRTFMDREADDAGLTYWKTVLSGEGTRESILLDFVWSPEFKAIMEDYGLK